LIDSIPTISEKKPEVSLVIPLYNEEETIPFLVERLNKLMDSMKERVEVVLINDGSKDNTEQLIYAIALDDERYQVVSLSRNFGHQIAVSAGLEYANGTEAVMVLDGDLQDPPELLPEFYAKCKEGYDVVYAVRKKRKENFVKRIAYHGFYRMLRSMSSIEMPLDSGDFSLMSRRVVDLIKQMPEESRYVRGMRAWVGFKQIGLEYDRQARETGDSKYSFKQLFQLAYNGIFNFSEVPIKFITRLGILIIIISVLFTLYNLVLKLFFDVPMPQGFTALLFVISMFGGVQLISIGVIGEYIVRIFFQSKQRPLFVVKTNIQNKKVNEHIKLKHTK
jgi:glycosyltransferase involved in cell wall biosynthesis